MSKESQEVRLLERAASVLLVCVCVAPLSAGMQVETSNLIGSIRYKTFVFDEGTPALRRAAQERIHAAVERELEAKGVRRVFGETELNVATHVIVDRHSMADLDRPDYWEYWIGVSSVDAFDVRGGTLVVDLVDMAQQRTVWRGVASIDVKGSVDKNLKLIDKMVKRLFSEFPPQ
jgi:hypothetical protein